MRVLVGCENSGIVRAAFRRRDHEAFSCDLLPVDDGGPHIQGDIFEALKEPWDLLICHPPCTYLSVSGMHWCTYKPGHKTHGDPVKAAERKQKVEDAVDFVRRLLLAPVHRICLENPVGIISTRIRRPDQVIHPNQFGHDASKKTCLWLKNLPLLQSTRYIEPRMVNGKPRWANQTDSGQNRLGPSEDRWKLRAKTYEGIAEAMAEQWSLL